MESGWGNSGLTHSFEYPNSSVQVKTDQHFGTNDNSAVVIKQNSKPIIFMYNGHLGMNIDGESQVNFPMITDLNGYPLTTESYYEDHTSFAQANSYKTRVFKTEGSNGTNQTFHKEDFMYSSSRPNSGKIIHTNNGRYIINTQYSENAYIYVHNSLYSYISYLTVIDNNLALPGIPFVDGDPTYNRQIVANNAGIIGYKSAGSSASRPGIIAQAPPIITGTEADVYYFQSFQSGETFTIDVGSDFKNFDLCMTGKTGFSVLLKPADNYNLMIMRIDNDETIVTSSGTYATKAGMRYKICSANTNAIWVMEY